MSNQPVPSVASTTGPAGNDHAPVLSRAVKQQSYEAFCHQLGVEPQDMKDKGPGIHHGNSMYSTGSYGGNEMEAALSLLVQSAPHPQNGRHHALEQQLLADFVQDVLHESGSSDLLDNLGMRDILSALSEPHMQPNTAITTTTTTTTITPTSKGVPDQPAAWQSGEALEVYEIEDAEPHYDLDAPTRLQVDNFINNNNNNDDDDGGSSSSTPSSPGNDSTGTLSNSSSPNGYVIVPRDVQVVERRQEVAGESVYTPSMSTAKASHVSPDSSSSSTSTTTTTNGCNDGDDDDDDVDCESTPAPTTVSPGLVAQGTQQNSPPTSANTVYTGHSHMDHTAVFPGETDTHVFDRLQHSRTVVKTADNNATLCRDRTDHAGTPSIQPTRAGDVPSPVADSPDSGVLVQTPDGTSPPSTPRTPPGNGEGLDIQVFALDDGFDYDGHVPASRISKRV